MAKDRTDAAALMERILFKNKVAIFTLSYCKNSQCLKRFLQDQRIAFYNIDIDEHRLYKSLIHELNAATRQKMAPFVFIKNDFIGSYKTILEMYHSGELLDRIEGISDQKYDFDVIVVGGGCGGFTVAKEAAQIGKCVAVFDFVVPNKPGGTQWSGLGGTCINCGSLHKRLMNQASLTASMCEDGKYFGYKIDFDKVSNHNWKEMMGNIQTYVKKLGAGFKKHCMSHNVQVFNALVLKFLNSHTIEAEDKTKKKARFTSKVFVLSTGGRPNIPVFPGSEHVITSEELFNLTSRPGKCLVIGGGFVAIESASFLISMGVDCTIFVRTEILKNCDSQCKDMIISHLKSLGVRFITENTDIEIIDRRDTGSKNPGTSSNLRYELKLKHFGSLLQIASKGDLFFDMVIVATGRRYNVHSLGLQDLGVTFNSENGKIHVNKYDRTACPTIFAVGDVVDGHQDLAPIAIKAARLLVKRMTGSEDLLDYSFIPVALFTPVEYGFCGYKEDDAYKEFGFKNVMVFHNRFYPVEWALQQRHHNHCYVKILCLKPDNNRVIGIHILGPNAGEITQGFAFAMKLKGTKHDLDNFLGIHPTTAGMLLTTDLAESHRDRILKSSNSLTAMIS